jgi:hypothetical protein
MKFLREYSMSILLRLLAAIQRNQKLNGIESCNWEFGKTAEPQQQDATARELQDGSFSSTVTA